MRVLDASRFPKEVFPLNMGEEAGFERIFLLYHAPLRYFCERIINEGDACEDLVSQLFLTLWQKQIQFETAEHAQAYLYRSAKNACLNYLRSEQRAKAKDEAALSLQPEIFEDYLQAFIRTEVWAELYRAIESLPSQCSKVIKMSYLEGLSNQEIADSLELTIQTVKNHKLRGLGLLKDRLPDSLLVVLTALLLK